MPRYKVEWSKGSKYSAEVLASTAEEAWKKAQRLSGVNVQILDHFVTRDKVENVSEGQLLKYSFDERSARNCTKEEAIAFLESTTKPIVYTYGLAYRRPGTYREPMEKAKAIGILKNHCLVDVDEEPECVHVNEISGSDMW